MLEPIGVVNVYVRSEDLTLDPYINRDYLNLFCREWGVTPKSYEMALECEAGIEKLNTLLLSENDPLVDSRDLGIYGLIPLYNNIVSGVKADRMEGYLVINRELHDSLYNPDHCTEYDRTFSGGLEPAITYSTKKIGNPKIIVAKGSGEIKKGRSIWFSDSALDYLDILKSPLGFEITPSHGTLIEI